MTSISICAYPWDLIGDPEASRRLAETGADRVALAAAYHSVRAATPMHPSHRVIDAEEAAFYVPVREEVWSDRSLLPRAAGKWLHAGEEPSNPFGEAAQEAINAGLEVDAWTVLLHSTVLGQSNPDLCVRNAFGDTYTHALCPANSDVVDYALTVVAEVAELAGRSGATGLMIEACGPLGVSHLGHHDKTSGADWTPIDEALLSLCFCQGCTMGMLSAGIDVATVRAAVRSAVQGGYHSVEKALGPPAASLLMYRQETTRRLAAGVRTASHEAGIKRLAFHAQPDPWAVGPFTALASLPSGYEAPSCAMETTFLLPGATASGLGAEEVSMLRYESSAQLGAYISALPPQDAANLASDWNELLERGFDELCIYHFGLLSHRRLAAVGNAVPSLRT